MLTYDEIMARLANFTDEPPPGYVRREGLVFRCGEYPDKNFSLSEEEADAAIANFTPVPGDLEHTPTVLSGKLGILQRIWRKGVEIFGAADVPEWLHQELEETRSGISLSWDRKTKKPLGFGWVLDPRVQDAALMSAYADFAAHELEREQREPSATVTVRMLRQRGTLSYLAPRQVKEKHYMTLTQSLRAAFSRALGQPEPTPAPTPAPTPTPAPEPEPVPSPDDAAPAAQFAAPGSSVSVLEMDEPTAEFRAGQMVTSAEQYVDAQIAAGHLYSFGREAALACFTNAAYDNEVNGPTVVTFARADNRIINDRVQMLIEMLNATPQASLFSQKLPVYVLNGDKPSNEKLSAAEQGLEQARKYNEQVARERGLAQS